MPPPSFLTWVHALIQQVTTHLDTAHTPCPCPVTQRSVSGGAIRPRAPRRGSPWSATSGSCLRPWPPGGQGLCPGPGADTEPGLGLRESSGHSWTPAGDGHGTETGDTHRPREAGTEQPWPPWPGPRVTVVLPACVRTRSPAYTLRKLTALDTCLEGRGHLSNVTWRANGSGKLHTHFQNLYH